MRLQLLDTTVRFSCSGCTRCCDQPWRTLVDADLLPAIEAVDWAAEFPDMAGRLTHQAVRREGRIEHELGKGEGTRCVFLHDDGRCRIHMKLGYEAKPRMCRQFPFIAAAAGDADRVSANYGCRAIQDQLGEPLAAQAEAVAATVALSRKAANAGATLWLLDGIRMPHDEANGLLEYLGRVAVGDSSLSAVHRGRSIGERLGVCLTIVERAVVRLARPNSAESGATLGEIPIDLDRASPYASAAAGPLPARLLLAATLFPDTLPADSPAAPSLWRRLSLVPRLMSLANIRGGYPSRVLGRNVSVSELLDRPATMRFSADSTDLLGRYLRSRLWQQFPGGTLLPLYAGLHQHILDLSAVLFFATALTPAGQDEIDLAATQKSLMFVEFHLANQTRLYDQVLKGWLKGALCAPEVAWASLRMMRLRFAGRRQAVAAG